MWNKTPMKPLGEANLTVKNPSTGDERIITLIVVPNGHANLLGFKTVQYTCVREFWKYIFERRQTVMFTHQRGIKRLRINTDS
jgi:hypothetical protein